MAQLLSNLPVGARVKFGKYSVNGEPALPITWQIVDKTIPSAITLLTEKIIDVLHCDDPEPNNSNQDRKNYGNNRYKLSNIDQWLNEYKAGNEWYVASHGSDAPPASGVLPYVQRPGFLNAFSLEERQSIIDTTVESAISPFDGGGSEYIVRKVFLPSLLQVGAIPVNIATEGWVWAHFAKNAVRTTSMTEQAANNTKWQAAYIWVGVPMAYWTRTPSSANVFAVQVINHQGNISEAPANNVGNGVRPAINVLDTLLVSDSTDAEGSYTIIFNTAPTEPPTIVTPPTIYGGKSNSVSWVQSVDREGDTVTYQLDCSLNGGEYVQIYNGSALGYAQLVPFGTSTVTYRVKAIDTSGESSAYTISDTFTVVNNNAPTISGADTNLGVKSEGFTGTYTVTDANGNTVTITEAIDGVQIRSLVATLGEEVTYGVTETTWLALSNGSHTLTISATDGIDTTVRTIVFTKLVDKFTIQNSTPWASSTMPSRIMLVVTRNGM